MKFRDIVGLIIAVLLAIVVVLLAKIFLSEGRKPTQEAGVHQQTEITKILVAAKPLSVGTIIKPGDLVWRDWPQTAFVPSYIKEGTLPLDSFTGAIVRFHLNKDEPVSIASVVKEGEKGILAAIVSSGKRAISIDVTPQSASSGLIFPGDYVDIILSKAAPGSAGGAQLGQSRTVVKNVKVLAMDIEMNSDQGKPKTPPRVATLEVTPAEAETITAATKEGTLSLSLHSLAEEPSTANIPNLEEVSAQLPKQNSVILMRGNDKTEIQVQEQ